jgi:hypothetical protein
MAAPANQLPSLQVPALTKEGVFNANWVQFFLNLWTRTGGASGTPLGGLPTGGAAGQVLEKTSSANYAAGWGSLAKVAKTGIATDLLLAEPGLLGNNGGSAVEVLGIGAGLAVANGQLEATGVPLAIQPGYLVANLATHAASPLGTSLSAWLDFVWWGLAGVANVIGAYMVRGAAGWQVNSPYSLLAPLTGFTAVVPDATDWLVLAPAGTLATGTVTMPADPYDGQSVGLVTTQTITALTVSPNAGQTLLNAPTTLAAGAGVRWQYVLSLTTWIRLQ